MLQSLNTKGVGVAGVLSFIVGLLTYGPFQDAVSSILGAKGAQYASLAFIVAGFAAAYYGMPHTVPTSPDAPQPAAAPQKAA